MWKLPIIKPGNYTKVCRGSLPIPSEPSKIWSYVEFEYKLLDHGECLEIQLFFLWLKNDVTMKRDIKSRENRPAWSHHPDVVAVCTRGCPSPLVLVLREVCLQHPPQHLPFLFFIHLLLGHKWVSSLLIYLMNIFCWAMQFWRRTWTGKPTVLQAMGSQRVGHDWATELNLE